MNVIAHNPDTDELEKTFITKRTAAADTQFKVKNTHGFDNGKRVLIGEMSRERSEILTVDSVTDTQITFTTGAKFPHDADDPVYILDYDQVRFYRSTTGRDGLYELINTSDLDVDNSSGKTIYDDPNALDTYWYEVAYYHSTDDMESEHSPKIQATGYPADSVGAAIQEVVGKVKDKEFIQFEIEDWIAIMNDISNDLLTQAKRPYRFLRTRALLDVEAGALSVDFPADFWKVDYTEVNGLNPSGTANIFQPKKLSPEDMRYRQSQELLASDDVYHIAYDDFRNVLLFNPPARTDRIGAFSMYYYKTFTRFTSMSDTIETPNNLVYKLGMWREFYMSKADEDSKYMAKALQYEKQYNAEVMKLQREKNIEAGGPSGMSPDRKLYRQFGYGRRYRQ